MLALLLAALGGSGVVQDTSTARAESLLAVGRIQFARPVVGRYAALEAFRAASRLAPTNPEPLYWQMKVGFFLGSDEGDVLAREAILKILELTPDYQDVWERFEMVYHNPSIWRRADRALARHPDDLIAMERRAELAISLEQPLRADSLVAEVLQRRGEPSVAGYVARAEANFNAARDSAGYAWYDSALVYADSDPTGAMWDAVWMIATPDEIRAQDATPPGGGGRRQFFERFWAKRDANVVTGGNERIAEHFRRIAYARRYFRLLHPLNLYHRSPRYRAIIAQTQRDYLQQSARAGEPYPGSEADQMLAGSRSLPDVAPGAGTNSALAGLDARGLIYVRLGAPEVRLRGYLDPLHQVAEGAALDIEGWLYHTPEGTLTIGFRRGSGSTHAGMAAGDFIFLPTNRRQAWSTKVALRTDHTTVPAPLEARAWSAYFKSPEPGLTDAYYKAKGDSAGVVLWDANDTPLRASGAGLLQLIVPPGTYRLGFDVVSAGVLGRTRRDAIVPRFSQMDLGLSSLALAPAASLLERDAALRGMPADLVYPTGTPLSAYVEVYGLTADQSGRSQYRVRYEFAPVRSLPARLIRGTRPVVFAFDRSAFATPAVEQLVIEPGKVPSGRYRVTVVVTDLQRNVKSESAAIDVTIR